MGLPSQNFIVTNGFLTRGQQIYDRKPNIAK
jgi:hypothetical protein